MRAHLLLAALLLSGCASVIKPTNELRVNEITGQGSYLLQVGGQGGGCRVVQEGVVTAHVVYTGDSCEVELNAPVEVEGEQGH